MMLPTLAQRGAIALSCLLALVVGPAMTGAARESTPGTVAAQTVPPPCEPAPRCSSVAPVVPPPRTPISPVRLDRVAVDATVSDGIATTRVTQEVHNPTERPQEATYLFPLPVDAAVSDFALWVDGERWDAELLPSAEARRLYESIVRERRDPALLEYAGRGVFRARIFPVPPGGSRQVTLEYTQALTPEAGLNRFSYPLAGGAQGGTLSSLGATVRLRSAQPLRAIYSPSHDVAIQRLGDNEAVISFEASNVAPRGSFDLVYGTGQGDVAATLLSYRRGNEDGTFLLLLAPRPQVATAVAKDVILVLDTSGSMSGPKIEQARGALRYVLENLNGDDRFSVVTFNTVVETFADGLQPLAARPRALAYVDRLTAQGGTNIHEALLTALRQVQPERPTYLIFLTDGQPTNGITDPNRIARAAGDAAAPNVRLFVFGVGYDVNTVLLDRLARENRGTADYVKPEENLEERLSAFYTKVASPVLTDVRLEFSRPTRDLYPDPLPDLFAGQQLLVVGRYPSGGPTTVTLEGSVDGRRERLAFGDLTLVDDDRRANYLPGLWATRRVGTLLERLRLLGTSREVVDEVVALSTRYGIVTPYTSFFVNEQVDVANANGRREAGDQVQRQVAAAPPAGAAGVAASQTTQALQNAPVAGGASPRPAAAPGRGDPASTLTDARVQRVADRAFVLRDNVWVDTAYVEGQPRRRVSLGADDYFALLTERPELAAYFAIGERVIVVLDGVAYEVASD
jgi:Ca-activated chloride channel homolog